MSNCTKCQVHLMTIHKANIRNNRKRTKQSKKGTKDEDDMIQLPSTSTLHVSTAFFFLPSFLASFLPSIYVSFPLRLRPSRSNKNRSHIPSSTHLSFLASSHQLHSKTSIFAATTNSPSISGNHLPNTVTSNQTTAQVSPASHTP